MRKKTERWSNSARWLQWKNAAVPPPGDARLDQDILAQIFLRIRALYQKEGGKFPDPVLHATWAYTDPQHPSLAEVTKEINGKALADLKDRKTQQEIKTGTAIAGFRLAERRRNNGVRNWLYCGSWTEAGALLARRGTEDPSGLGIYPNWGWSWPMNRRVLYNRASCDLEGKPWDPSRKQVWWNEDAQKWVGNDVPDFKADSHPKDHMGPFIMNPEGVGRLFVPIGAVTDGPFPEHLRADRKPDQESAASGAVKQSSGEKTNDRGRQVWTPEQGYTVVCTTYRLTEQYHYWTKNNPMNVQLIPEPFVEIPVELANDLGIRGAEKIKVTSIARDIHRESFRHAANQANDRSTARRCIKSGCRFTRASAESRRTKEGCADAGELSVANGR